MGTIVRALFDSNPRNKRDKYIWLITRKTLGMHCLRSQILSNFNIFFCFLQKLGSNIHITVSICDTYTSDYFFIPKEINSVDNYFSLNLKVVVCVFKSKKTHQPSTPNNEAKPFHSILLSPQLLLLSLQLYFPQSCNMMLTSGRV